MKKDIILFVIGVLVGAIIATGAFYVYTTTNNSSNSNSNTQMNGGTPPEMPSGQNGGQPPEMPSNTTTDSNSTTN